MNTKLSRRSLLGAAPLAAVALAAGFTAAAAVGGCSKPDPKAMLLGDWRVRPTSAVVQGVKMTDDNTTRGEARALGSYLGSFTVSFRPDNSFTFRMGPTPMEGTWTLEGEKVTMSVGKMGGEFAGYGAAAAGRGAAAAPPMLTLSGELDPRLKVLNVEFPNLGGDAQQLQRLVFEKPDR